MSIELTNKELDLFKKVSEKLNDLVNELEGDIQELPSASAVNKLGQHQAVKGVITCALACNILCPLTAEVGNIPIGVAGFAGSCAAVCALTAGIGTVIAGAGF